MKKFEVTITNKAGNCDDVTKTVVEANNLDEAKQIIAENYMSIDVELINDGKWECVGEIDTVRDILPLITRCLKENKLDTPIRAMGAPINVMYNGNVIVLEDEDRTEEWNEG